MYSAWCWVFIEANVITDWKGGRQKNFATLCLFSNVVDRPPFSNTAENHPPRRAEFRRGAVRLGLGEWRRQNMPPFPRNAAESYPLVALLLDLVQCGLVWANGGG